MWAQYLYTTCCVRECIYMHTHVVGLAEGDWKSAALLTEVGEGNCEAREFVRVEQRGRRGDSLEPLEKNCLHCGSKVRPAQEKERKKLFRSGRLLRARAAKSRLSFQIPQALVSQPRHGRTTLLPMATDLRLQTDIHVCMHASVAVHPCIQVPVCMHRERYSDQCRALQRQGSVSPPRVHP